MSQQGVPHAFFKYAQAEPVTEATIAHLKYLAKNMPGTRLTTIERHARNLVLIIALIEEQMRRDPHKLFLIRWNGSFKSWVFINNESLDLRDGKAFRGRAEVGWYIVIKKGGFGTGEQSAILYIK